MFNNKNNNTKAAILFYKSATASSRSRLDRTEQSNDMTPARPTIAFHRVTATDTTLHVPLLPSLSANKKFVIWCISSKDSVSRWVRQNYPIRDVYRQQRTRPPPVHARLVMVSLKLEPERLLHSTAARDLNRSFPFRQRIPVIVIGNEILAWWIIFSSRNNLYIASGILLCIRIIP